MNPISISKRKISWEFFNPFLDLIFPPLCLSCREPTREKFFCKACWELCALPNPIDHCRYCFEPLYLKLDLCPECLIKRKLPAIRGNVFEKGSPAYLIKMRKEEALAAFAYIQWSCLDWEKPDAIIPMPNAKRIAKELTKYMKVPFVPALNTFSEYREDYLEEDQVLLVLDRDSSFKELEMCTQTLKKAFPIKIYLLSLFPRD